MQVMTLSYFKLSKYLIIGDSLGYVTVLIIKQILNNNEKVKRV